MAAQRALALAAPAEAIELYRRALSLDPTPERQMNLGQALQRSNELGSARAAFETALQGFVARGDRRGAARAALELGAVSFPSGRFGDVLHWAETSLSYLDAEADPEAHAKAHFLLGAGQSAGGGSFADAETHLLEASRIAAEHHLPGMASQIHFELGNLLAQRGELAQSLQAYQDAVAFAQQADDPLQEVLAHNNYAYHAHLLGELSAAHDHIEVALNLADAKAIQMPRQYLYSTRGEIALAERQWDEAEAWFHRGISEAEKAGNKVQAANYQANLGLVAQGRGDADGALILLESAYRLAHHLSAPYLQTQIDLWLADLYLQRGERFAAEEVLRRAESRMSDKDYHRLRDWAARLRTAQMSAEY
jgi:tetratricopeptide (TPR) repeat protein